MEDPRAALEKLEEIAADLGTEDMMAVDRQSATDR